MLDPLDNPKIAAASREGGGRAGPGDRTQLNLVRVVSARIQNAPRCSQPGRSCFWVQHFKTNRSSEKFPKSDNSTPSSLVGVFSRQVPLPSPASLRPTLPGAAP